jgi:hypothetical protein
MMDNLPSYIREKIIAEIDAAINNRFQMNPQQWSGRAVRACWVERNRVARLFDLPERKLDSA